MTRVELNNQIDVILADNVADESLTPQTEAGAIKLVADYTDDNFEILSNKSQDIATDTGSEDKYTSVKAVEDYAQPKNTCTEYKVIMTQSSTNAPVVNNVLSNTIGSIVWTRISTGLYHGTLAGAFNNQKTFLSISPLASGLYEIFQEDSDIIIIKTLDVSTLSFADGFLNKTSVLIQVYP